jgi:hypothetical protein
MIYGLIFNRKDIPPQVAREFPKPVKIMLKQFSKESRVRSVGRWTGTGSHACETSPG